MLDNLRNIDWDNLTCGVDGSATRVPGYIRQLRSRNRRTCEQAIRDLQARINQDGVVFEATPLAVPFLLELLQARRVQCKDLILWILSWLTSPDYDTYAAPQNQKDWYRQAFDVVSGGSAIYRGLLHDRDVKVRNSAFDLLTRPRLFPENTLPGIAQALVEFIQHEPNADSKALALLKFGDFIGQQREHFTGQLNSHAALLESIWHDEPEQQVSQAAAVALARIAREQAPPELAPYLRDIAVYNTATGQVRPTAIMASLWHLGLDRWLLAMTQALAQAPDEHRARDLANALLAGVFRNHPLLCPPASLIHESGREYYQFRAAPEQRDLNSLTPLQKQALKAMLNTGRVWETPHNMLDAYGLPEREILSRWLSSEEAGR